MQATHLNTVWKFFWWRRSVDRPLNTSLTTSFRLARPVPPTYLPGFSSGLSCLFRLSLLHLCFHFTISLVFATLFLPGRLSLNQRLTHQQNKRLQPPVYFLLTNPAAFFLFFHFCLLRVSACWDRQGSSQSLLRRPLHPDRVSSLHPIINGCQQKLSLFFPATSASRKTERCIRDSSSNCCSSWHWSSASRRHLGGIFDIEAARRWSVGRNLALVAMKTVPPHHQPTASRNLLPLMRHPRPRSHQRRRRLLRLPRSLPLQALPSQSRRPLLLRSRPLRRLVQKTPLQAVLRLRSLLQRARIITISQPTTLRHPPSSRLSRPQPAMALEQVHRTRQQQSLRRG